MSERDRRRAAEGKHPLAQRLASIYAHAQTRISVKVLQALGSARMAERRWRRARSAEIAAIIKDTREAASPLTGRLIRDVFIQGAQAVAEARRERAQRPARETLSRVEAEAVNTITEELSGRLDDALSTVGRGVEDIFRREGLAAAARQLVAELPEPAAAGALRSRLERQGLVAFIDRAGRRWNLDTYTAMVVRTVSAEAVNQGVATRMLGRELDLVDVTYSGDHYHAEGGKEECAPYHGRTFSLTGQSDEYPKLDWLPPFHPACRHLLKPSRANFVVVERDRELVAA